MAWTQEGKVVTLRIPKNLWIRLEKIWKTNRYNHMKQGEFIKNLLSEYTEIIESRDVEPEAVNEQKKGNRSKEDLAQ